MTWNYRVIMHKGPTETWFGVHEVYYDENGIAKSWTERPTDFAGDSAETVVRMLEMALEDARKRPILRVEGDKLYE